MSTKQRAAPADALSRRMDIAGTATAQAAEDLAEIARTTESRGWIALALLQRRVAELVHGEIEHGQEVR